MPSLNVSTNHTYMCVYFAAENKQEYNAMVLELAQVEHRAHATFEHDYIAVCVRILFCYRKLYFLHANFSFFIFFSRLNHECIVECPNIQ